MPTAGILIIGNEILSGKVVDTNSPYLCRELRSLGVDVERIVTIPDMVDVIAAEVKQMSRAYDFVFTSGGIGPTHDDLTIEGVAAAFGRPNPASRLPSASAAPGATSPTRACSRWRWFPPARRCWTRATSGSRW
jgi:molybdenum cofactor synthesis domain-containing protein